MAKIKSKTVTSSSGKTRVVKIGSKADARYSGEAGATTSTNKADIRAANDVIKANTTSRTNADPLSVTENDGGTVPAYIPPPTITSSGIAPATAINLPTPPAPSATGTQAMTVIGSTPPPTPAEASDSPLKDYIKSLEKAPKAEDIYDKTKRESGVVSKERTVNNLSAQLGAITAKATADKLSLEGQGRGVTDVIIGGQQAQIDREAAIQSLPIAAQLSAAQDDLESAQNHLDTLFKIRLEDAQHKVDYKNKINDLVFNYATDKQKEALADRRAQDNRNFDTQRDNINYARDLAATALANGQSSLAARLMGLDSSSSSYSKDIANLASGLQKQTDSNDVVLASTEKQILLGAGLSTPMINAIQRDINDYGIDTVLASPDLTGSQKDAIRKVYGAAETASGLGRSDVATILGIKDDGSGKIFGFGESTSEKLDKVMESVLVYRNAGYTDKDIVELLKKSVTK